MSRLVAYGLSTVLSGVVAILTIPFMIAASGLAPWGAAATGQGAGMIAFVVLQFGWGVRGPADVAIARAGDRPLILADSLRARLVLAAVVLPASCVVVAAFASAHWIYAVLGLLSIASSGLTSPWYLIGAGQAWLVFFLDTLPRVLGTAVGTAAMVVFGLDAWWSLVGTTVGAFAASGLQALFVLGRYKGGSRSLSHRPVRKILREQSTAAWTGALTALYAGAPILIVTAVNPAAVAVFGLLDRVSKQATTACTPILNVAQGWVPHGRSATELSFRIRRMNIAAIVMALMLALGALALGPLAIEVISHHTADVGRFPSLLTGLAAGLYMLEAILSRACLVPLGGMAAVGRITTVGIIIGIGAIAALAAVGGAAAAMAGFCIGMGVRVVALEWQVVRRLGSRAAESAASSAEELSEHLGSALG